MPLKTISKMDVRNKRVLVRVDFNVPLENGRISDDTRMRSALPTINELLKKGASVVLMSHLGRPGGKPNLKFSLVQIRKHLEKLAGVPVKMAPDVIGEKVRELSESLNSGEILLLENTRFYTQETANEPEFAAALASLGDYYVNDAFGAAHRAHASTEGITHFLPSFAGLLMERECSFFDKVVQKTEKPLVAIIGGAKVSSKIAVLDSLLDKADIFIIGGGMAYTFLREKSFRIGNSLVETEYADVARTFLENAERRGTEVILPLDHVAADRFAEDAAAQKIPEINIPDNIIAMDIGPKTIKAISDAIKNAGTLLWNGPMGVFEFDSFAKGTLEVAKMVAECSAVTIVGGGDSAAAVNKFNLADKIDHVSTGGGASLEYLEGNVLPGVAALKE